MKQKTLRIFEVEDFEKLEKIIKTKYPLIKNHFFMLKEKNEKIEDLLRRNNLNYFIVNGDVFTANKEKKEEIKIIYKEKVIYQDVKTEIYDRIIRSGEEIEKEGNFIFLQRINAGAKINIKGNVEIFDENEGLVFVEGNYLIVKKNIKGTIIFNGEEKGKIEKLTIFTKDFTKVLE